MYEIIGIHVSSKPHTLGTITHYYFQGQNGEPSSWLDKPTAVAYVRQNPVSVNVSGGGSTALVEVVPNGNASYLRTKGDGTTNDNLLSQTVH
jgi:hypothetical protein